MRKKIIVCTLIISLFLFGVVGCSNKKENTNQDNKPMTVQQKTNEITQNKDFTKKLKDEKGVINGQVYEQNGMVISTILLDKKVNDKDAKALAQKYVEELKSKYKDKKVNVQAVRNGKNVANITKK